MSSHHLCAGDELDPVCFPVRAVVPFGLCDLRSQRSNGRASKPWIQVLGVFSFAPRNVKEAGWSRLTEQCRHNVLNGLGLFRTHGYRLMCSVQTAICKRQHTYYVKCPSQRLGCSCSRVPFGEFSADTLQKEERYLK